MQARLRRSSLIGDKDFYKKLLAIAIPIIIQNGITNFVNLLDNLMVGAVGTDEMSGVAIVNQLIFVFNLAIFGGLSGAGIFAAQFHGKGDHEGVRETFRFKLILSAILLAVGVAVFLCFGEPLIAQYLNEGSETGDLVKTAGYARDYLAVALVGLAPFALQQAYASTLRETGETLLPMKAGIVAIFVNLVLNYIFIFGNFGAPKMGVQGAALGTIVSRFVECLIVVLWTHRHKERNPFIIGAYKTRHIEKRLTRDIIKRGMPLLLNEFLWSLGVAELLKIYSMRGLAVVAAMNISSTITNLFNIVMISMGNCVAIIVGQHLGANRFDEARLSARRIIAFSVVSTAVIGGILALLAPLFPNLYRTTDEVRTLAAQIIRIAALFMPMNAFLHATYFTIRSGGKTWITFLFDCAYMWAVSIPTALLLTYFTDLDILTVYFCCCGIDIIKCTVGYILLKKGIWLHNIAHRA